MNTSLSIRRTLAAAAVGLTVAGGVTAVAGAATQVIPGGDSRGATLNRTYGNEWTRMSSAQFRTIVWVFGADVTKIPLARLKTFVGHAVAAARSGYPVGAHGSDWALLGPAQYRAMVNVFGSDIAQISLASLRGFVARAAEFDASAGGEAKNELSRGEAKSEAPFTNSEPPFTDCPCNH